MQVAIHADLICCGLSQPAREKKAVLMAKKLLSKSNMQLLCDVGKTHAC